MRNLFLLPTDKVSRLYQIRNKPLILDSKFESGTTNKHIYITNDEKIKVGDWVINTKGANEVYKVVSFNGGIPLDKNGNGGLFTKKIILTTDPKLIADGVQAIDDTFLEWFVKNPICEFVEWSSEKIEGSFDGENWKYKYGTVIPKEETKQECKGCFKPLEECVCDKQETLQDLLNKKANQSSTVDLDAYANGLDAGAEWQAERMYSYDELRRIAYNAYCLGQLENPTESKYNLWIQKFKK